MLPVITTHSSVEFWKFQDTYKSRNFLYYFFLTPQYCVKSVRIRSFFGSYFRTFGLNMERYSVSFHIQYKQGKIQTKKTSNTDTFQTVSGFIQNQQLLIYYYYFNNNLFQRYAQAFSELCQTFLMEFFRFFCYVMLCYVFFILIWRDAALYMKIQSNYSQITITE